MQIERDRIKLVPMTNEKYRLFFREYENDPDMYLAGQDYKQRDWLFNMCLLI